MTARQRPAMALPPQRRPAPEPGWLTVDEIADALRVSPMTVYREIQRGRLPAARIGGRVIRVRRTDVYRYIQHALEADDGEQR